MCVCVCAGVGGWGWMGGVLGPEFSSERVNKNGGGDGVYCCSYMSLGCYFSVFLLMSVKIKKFTTSSANKMGN